MNTYKINDRQETECGRSLQQLHHRKTHIIHRIDLLQARARQPLRKDPRDRSWMCFIILVCCHFKIHPFAISLIASRANHSFPRRCTLVACSQHELYRAMRPLIDIPDCFSRYCTHLITTASSEPFAEAVRSGVEATLSRFPDFHAMLGEGLRALEAIPHRSLLNPTFASFSAIRSSYFFTRSLYSSIVFVLDSRRRSFSWINR